MASNRQLAAIMFTDIVGYSKLMNRDEQEGLNLLSLNRSIHQRLIAQFNGQFIKEMGDGIMAAFQNSADALSCALEIYSSCFEKNITLRIGIHEDKVTFQDGDVFGDGVNVASRIESLGIPNSILFSKASFKRIKDKTEFNPKLIGSFTFKNIAEEFELYALAGKNLIVPKKELIQSRILKQQDNRSFKTYSLIVLGILIVGIISLSYFAFVNKQSEPPLLIQTPYPVQPSIKENSIAVLPFINSSNMKDQEYFSDGMMEEVLNRLFQIKELTVLSRTSTMKYKDTELTTNEIAQQLGVANILEGSVRIIDDSVRINLKLIDGQTDITKWAASFNRELKAIFSLQSEIAQKVAQQLKVQINQELISRMESSTTNNPEVWKLFMRSKYSAANQNDIEKAVKLLEEVIAIEPNFAPAHAELGYSWLVRGTYLGDLTPEEVLEEAFAHLNKAKALDPNYPITHVYLAAMNLWFNWDFKAAEKEWNEFYRLSPSDQTHDVGYVDFLNASGRFEEAVAISNRMLATDASESSSWSTGLSIYFSGQPEKAVKHFEEALELFPIPSIISDAARTFVFTGNYQRAIDILKAETSNPTKASARSLGNIAVSYYHLKQPEKATAMLNILKERSKVSPVGSPAFYAAMVLAQMHEIDEAFFYLDRAFTTHEVEMFWLNVEPPFAPLKADPRWQEIIRKVGFPSVAIKN